MLYKTDVGNMAIGRLGISSTIADLETDLSTEGKILRRHFRTSLNTILEEHQWNFARGVQELILQFNDPEEGYLYSYYMPNDALVIRQLAYQGRFVRGIELHPGEKIPYDEIYSGSTRLLYTNLEEAHAEYTRIVEENSAFPTHFARAFAAQLSKDIAPSLITSKFPKIQKALNDSADNDISRGIADDLARQPQYVQSESSFVRARY